MVVLFGRTRRYNTNHFLPYPYLSAFAFTRPATCVRGRIRAYRCTRVLRRSARGCVGATTHNASHARVRRAAPRRVHRRTRARDATPRKPFRGRCRLAFCSIRENAARALRQLLPLATNVRALCYLRPFFDATANTVILSQELLITGKLKT